MAIITLTSDMGQQDYLVGAIKGQLYSLIDNPTIVDISHQLSAFNYPQAVYICNSSFPFFPKGSFHIVLVNLFDEIPKQMLLAYHQGQYIACADNGLLSMIVEGKPEKVVGLSLSTQKNITALSCTHVLASAVAAIISGKAIEDIGNAHVEIVEKIKLKYVTTPTTMEGQIIFIDNFENVIVNITKEDFEKERKGRPFKIVFTRNEVIDTISETYSSVSKGEKVAFFNSSGYLEIAINNGNAAGLFGLKGYSEAMQKQGMGLQKKWFYQTVKIYFE